MQTSFISRNPGCRRVILIFAGWSTVPAFYRDLHAEGWDIAVVWDYSSLDFDATVIDGYETLFVVAWSMGVAAAAHAAATSLDPARVSAAFAVNGTTHPSSDLYGIPEAIFEATRATLNPRNLMKFTRRMGYTPPDMSHLPPLPASEIYIPDCQQLADELANVRDNALRGRLPWKRAFISSGDRIFPAESMRRAWENENPRPQIVVLDAPHYVHLQSVIDTITPDIAHIGRHFAKALPTYDENADAQRLIIDRLVEMLPAERLPKCAAMLEIGVGSGMLTRALAAKADITDALYVDLYPVPRLGLFEKERYVEADIEKWLPEVADGSFDLIATANTIQWLADPEAFFRNAARALRPGGRLLCSTFITGNLKELDSRRPSPLIYRSREELECMIRRYFPDVEMRDRPIRLEFRSRREMLLHLKLTGVAGGGASSLPIATAPSLSSPVNPTASSQIEAAVNGTPSVSSPITLTYYPLYISASTRKD
ncbi:MAG: DUF452 family protein [Muribaculaceae bacterium]|nr:DUF452 family protein [Muribaculaceae bacterium]